MPRMHLGIWMAALVTILAWLAYDWFRDEQALQEATAGAGETTPQRLLRRPFAGVWRLVAFEQVEADGRVSHPMGHDVDGSLVYTLDGRMSVHVLRRDRPAWTARERTGWGFLDVEPAELRRAYEGYNGYFGRYEIRPEQRVVVHHVEGGLVPDAAGRQSLRSYAFEAGRLRLEPPAFELEGRQVTNRLVWRRALSTSPDRR